MSKEIIKTKVLIIGGGLSGLALAYYLRHQDLNPLLVEARDRLGGRILTARIPGGASLELGATWFNPGHSSLFSLIEELGLSHFKQRMDEVAFYQNSPIESPHRIAIPPNQEASLRLSGGTSQLIEALAARVPLDKLCLGEQVSKIDQGADGIRVETNRRTIQAERVISTLPPNLLVSSIAFNPPLPEALVQVAHSTHTWMGESIKVGFRSEQPFWRAENSSGTLFTNTGPLTEMYDHSNAPDSAFALKGFVHPRFKGLTSEQRQQAIVTQLEALYGEAAGQLYGYQEYLWEEDADTYAPYPVQVMGHQNNGHRVYQQSYLGRRLLLAGTETATAYPGYMEGAVRRAKAIADELIQGLRQPR